MPNDTFQSDIGLTILDLSSGTTLSRLFDFGEDDDVHYMTPADRTASAWSGSPAPDPSTPAAP